LIHRLFRSFAFSLLILLAACKETAPEKKLNVILILTDDQGYGDLGIHGNESIDTPTLDRLGMESARFDRFYVSPLCAPTRASILTGRYHLRTGTVSVSNGLETMDAEEYTLAELFKDNDYQTGIFGKWHNGQHYPNHPLEQGFDEFTGFLAGHWSNYFDSHVEKGRKEQDLHGYLPDRLTDEAIAFLEKNKSKPFFTYLAYNTPHSPHQVPDEFFDPYKKKGLTDELAAIYGMVSNIDTNIGRLLEKVKSLGLEEQTLIIFLTDNGPNGVRYNAKMKGIKGSIHEGGVRVPSFWRLPGKIKPGLKEIPGAHIDILPTLVDLLGLKMEKKLPIDGVSLAPTLRGEDQSIHRSIFSHVAFLAKELNSRPGAIRKDSLVLTLSPDRLELYDLKNDPEQLKDLSLQFPELTAVLSNEYQDWWEDVTKGIEMDRSIPISNQSPEIMLAGYEASFAGQIRFFEGHGWAQDWLTNWVNPSDSISWDLNVLDPGSYQVLLEYTANARQVESELILRCGNSAINFKLDQVFEGQFLESPDRVPRKEAPEKNWKRIPIGTLELKKGKAPLSISAKKIASEGVGDIFSVRLIPTNTK